MWNSVIWKDTDLKRGKEIRFQPEFIFRKTPTVEVKQTQVVKHFKGLRYSAHSLSDPFLSRVYPYARKAGDPQTRWPLHLFHCIGPALRGPQTSSGLEKLQGRSNTEVPFQRLISCSSHYKWPSIIDINDLYDSKTEGSAGEPWGLTPSVKGQKELAI